MSQLIFTDPIVSAAPNRTGVGTGTVSIDRLTHFTVTQTYTLTCIAKSPDTLFSVAGSLDGNVGLAIVGTQFFDTDLKVFFTIQQGPIAFEVGDQFTFTVSNGTDLNQDNIDEYDESPQKNFGPGLRGTVRGDANIRYSDDDRQASRFIQGLKYVAQAAGVGGEAISIQYLAAVAAIAASRTIQDLTYTAQTPGSAGNSITLSYVEWTPAQAARVTIQNLEYQAVASGTGGNSITVAYTTGGTAGSEVVSVIGNAISIQIQSGVSTAAQIAARVAASLPASALVTTAFKPSPANSTNTQTAPVSPTNLTGGSNAIGVAGSEVVSVIGNAITVTMQGGVSTATQIKTAVDASSPAHALVSVAISGTGSNAQTSFVGTSALTGGANSVGMAGSESVVVSTNAIQVYLESGKSTATQVKAAIEASSPANALVSVSLVSEGASPQISPYAQAFLTGGKAKLFSLNHDEFSDSGSFVEGNGSANVSDLFAAGKAEFQSHVHVDDVLSLNAPSSGVAVPDAQKALNDLLQDSRLTLRTSDHTKLSWSKPLLTFEADILIDFTDTDVVNTIALANSPISISDGQSVYVILNRLSSATVTPIVASTVSPYPNAFRLVSRFGDNLIFSDNTLIRDGKSVRIGEGGDGDVARVQLYDPLDTTLPSGASATIDGVSVTNGMYVLFSNLSSGNNKVYKASGVGTSISWALQNVYPNGASPQTGDRVLAEQGSAFALTTGIFNGTTFEFNDKMRFFTGTDYWELSSLKTVNLSASSTNTVFSVTAAGSENWIIDYAVIRGSTKETGSLIIACQGSSVSLTTAGANLGTTGVKFQASIVSANLILEYVADGSGGSGTLKYFARRWSDSAGGPGGVPSYSGGSSGTGAAGSNTQIQFNDSGNLGADPDFTWDKTNNVLTLGSLSVTALNGPVILADNTASPATIFSYSASSYRFAIIEFSIVRDGAYQLGRALVTNDGTTAAIAVDSSSTGTTGITLSATISGGNVLIQFTSTATGMAGNFKYASRRWS